MTLPSVAYVCGVGAIGVLSFGEMLADLSEGKKLVHVPLGNFNLS